MSGAMLGFALLAVLGAVPLVWTICREIAAGRGHPLVLPLLAVGAGGLTLVVGSIHFGHGWPGTGGHPWAGRDIVPGQVARFCWAATLWITSYWAHPGALASFPAAEIGWMVVSPVAFATVLIGAAKTLGRLHISSRILRYESWLGLVAGSVMAVCLAGAGSWIVSGSPAPRGLFRVGAIDALGDRRDGRRADRRIPRRAADALSTPEPHGGVTRDGWTRRRFLAAGVSGCVGAAFAGLELVRARRAAGKTDARRARRRLLGLGSGVDVRRGGAVSYGSVLLGPAKSHRRLHDRLPAWSRVGQRAPAGDLGSTGSVATTPVDSET